MSAAIYIVPEKPVAGLDDFVNGSTVVQVDEVEVDDLCKRLKVKSLWDFVSQDPNEFADLLDGLELDDQLACEQWFSPEDGLRTVRALQGHLVSQPRSLSNADAFLEDLQDYEWVLSALAEQDVRWHFAVAV
ncbi:hypothetical protein A7D27_26200 [Pseudomonas sp. 1D4]|uniref:hypothetical protein n=1 Tax=Pseudomonadaceae TaxID=135621 RepID=UPI00084BB9D5|nr:MULTISPECIES: hypothetical protein [Pseudomonas]OEC36034.1 hypothetical protein A7D27_26200 [Pseudomonas sp. 1D4]OEC49929.1 hypothetical protein A9G05_25030 [Pseudomonas sp. ENNP23]